jgi:hypothetical protein
MAGGSPPSPPGSAPAPRSARCRAHPRRPLGIAASAHRLPDGFAWLVRLAPEAACFGGQLRHLLSDPEITALLSAAPAMGRVLRPLCRMLGVELGPDLLPPLSRPAGSPDRSRASGRSHANTAGRPYAGRQIRRSNRVAWRAT